MDLEPALEALSLVQDSSASRRLDLICLDVPNIRDDEQVESKKRKIKRQRRKQQTSVSSPLHPDRHAVGSLSLSEDLPVSRTDSVVESVTSSKPEEEFLASERLEEAAASPSTHFSDFFWPQVPFEQEESVVESSQTNGTINTNDYTDSGASHGGGYDFLAPVRYDSSHCKMLFNPLC